MSQKVSTSSARPKFVSKNTRLERSARVIAVDPVDPKAVARDLVSFDLSIDSVVATAVFQYDSSHRSIIIFWGDSDEGEVIDLANARHLQSFGGVELSLNTISIQHRYAEPEPPFLGMNLLFYTVLVDKDGRRSFGPAQRLRMVPRYKFILYPLILELNSHLDTFLEEDSELGIDMKATHNDEVFFEKHWNADITTNGNIGPLPGESRFPVTFTLTGSALQREIALDSEDGVVLNITAAENESWLNDVWDFLVDVVTIEFDGSNDIMSDGPRGFHPIYQKGSQQYLREFSVRDGSFKITLNTEMNLIVPLERPKTPLLTQG